MIDKEFKYAIFCYEDQELPTGMRLLEGLKLRFDETDYAPFTLMQTAFSLDEAAEMIDTFKAKTCGSPYSIALINLNHFPGQKFLDLLMSERALGNPWTLFQATLRSIDGPLYAMARDKVELEAEEAYHSGKPGIPSCIDAYTQNTIEEATERVLEILCARLEELETRARLRKTGKFSPISPTEAAMRKSNTTFFGNANTCRSGRTGRISGRWPRQGAGKTSSTESPTRTYPGPGLSDTL